MLASAVQSALDTLAVARADDPAASARDAKISLKNLARQLRKDPGDLILMLTGIRLYR